LQKWRRWDISAIETVGPLYEKAISSASRSAFLHHAALGNELYAIFLFVRQQEQGLLYELCNFQACETYVDYTTPNCDSKSASSVPGKGTCRAHARSHKGRSRFTSASSRFLHQGKSLKSVI
jgi:hypothetical protein